MTGSRGGREDALAALFVVGKSRIYYFTTEIKLRFVRRQFPVTSSWLSNKRGKT